MTRAFTIIDALQRSPAYFQARCGRLTGSVASEILSTLKKGGEPTGRRDLRMRLMLERLTGTAQEDGYTNAAMQWGIDHEADAFAAYQALIGDFAERTGFLSHTSLLAGCSLDGHVGDFDGILEIKCPFKSAVHFENLRAGVVPAEYMPQVIHNLWVSGAAWCDFLSFDPRFDLERQTMLVRVLRASVDVTAYELAVRTFLGEVERELAEAQQLRGGRRAA